MNGKDSVSVQDDIVANVEAKLAAWTFLPEGIV